MRGTLNYGQRTRAPYSPRFRGTRDLKFSVAEQEAIRDAEAALGYQPHGMPPAPHRAPRLARLLGGAFAVWLAFNLLFAIAQFVEHGLSSPTFVQNAQRPQLPKARRVGSSEAPNRNPRALPQMVKSFYPGAGTRPEPSSAGNVVHTNTDDPGGAAPRPSHEAQNGIQAGKSDKPAAERQETEPASCPEGQSIASIAYVNAPDDHIFRVVHCKPESLSHFRRGALHTKPGGHAPDSASLQQPSEVTEPQSLRSESSPQLSSVGVEARWLSFEPSHAEMFSGADARDGKPFPTQRSISSARSGRAVTKRSLLRRALGGVGGPVLRAVRSVAASVRGEIKED
jgi:hypothetical protein